MGAGRFLICVNVATAHPAVDGDSDALYREMPLGLVYAADKPAGHRNFRFRYGHQFDRYDAPNTKAVDLNQSAAARVWQYLRAHDMVPCNQDL
jgi:hypothetical protein